MPGVIDSKNEDWRVNAAYNGNADNYGFTAEQKALLKALTADPSLAPGDRVKLINDAAANLAGSIRFSGKTGAVYQDLYNVAKTYMSNPANNAPATPTEENLNAYTDAAMAAANTHTQTGVSSKEFSLLEFIQQKFTLRTIAFLLVAIILVWVGINGISTPAIKIARGAVQ